MKPIKALGIDLAKNVFELKGFDDANRTVYSKRVKRSVFLETVVQLDAEVIYMEACGGAHHWARSLVALGIPVELLPPHRVKAFCRGNKNDSNDAEAIILAGVQPTVRRVAIKTLQQQDIQSLHRVREQVKQQALALSNQIRGLLAEYGVVFAKSKAAFRLAIPELLGDAENALTDRLRALVNDQWQAFQQLDNQLKQYDRDLKALTAQIDDCRRLEQIEGVGPQTATAFYASIGDANQFKNGREVSAWLGLVPRERSSGEKKHLGGITKRGDRYLRTLLIHGARAMVWHAAKMKGSRGEWLRRCIARVGTHKATVALANKNARVMWALLAHNDEYRVTGATS